VTDTPHDMIFSRCHGCGRLRWLSAADDASGFPGWACTPCKAQPGVLDFMPPPVGPKVNPRAIRKDNPDD